MKPILISLKDLKQKPCEKYYDYIMDNYGKNDLFNPLEIVKKLDGNYSDVSWLIVNCKKYQTKEMVEYYKALKPKFNDVSWLIKNCNFVKQKKCWIIINYLNQHTIIFHG